jgi:hypothetical protein
MLIVQAMQHLFRLLADDILRQAEDEKWSGLDVSEILKDFERELSVLKKTIED